jgi:NAD(P)-dependent dehydrogenase (short-subunit alcohol dehydrogenase family)
MKSMPDDSSEPKSQRVALIIGGTGAIGEAIARTLSAMDNVVVVAARGAADLQRDKADKGFEFLSMDLTRPASVIEAFQRLVERHGRLDVLVNAAGGASRISPVLRMPLEEWDEQHAVHSRGAMAAAQSAGRIMRKQRSGRIIHVASLAGHLPVQPGFSAYTAAKAAMISLTKCLNQELNQYGIQSTAICPAYVDTPVWQRTEIDRSQFLQPGDVAATVAYLCQLPSRVRIDSIMLEVPVRRPSPSSDNHQSDSK